MFLFKPNFNDSHLPAQYLMSELQCFSQVPSAYAYEFESGNRKEYIAFSIELSCRGFSEPADGRTLEEWLKERFFADDISPVLYPPGHFYRRMWRPPGYLPRHLLVSDPQTVTQAALSINSLIERMQELFTTIEPSSTNNQAFGRRIREMLLLACMEVEAAWTGVLKEHNYKLGSRYTTRDYVKLHTPMCLENYEIGLRWYPDFPTFKPFAGWDTASPTQSLGWYDAYNATKHDRESNLSKATLEKAIHAVGASIVMFYSQFGIAQEEEILTRTITSFFSICLLDQFPERAYIPYGKDGGIYSEFLGGWTQQQYVFS